LIANPAADIAKRSSGNPDGHHTWTPEEVAQFRRKHAIGSKPRLAMELMYTLAFRRSDVIRLGPPDVRNGGSQIHPTQNARALALACRGTDAD
jgi:hypothetical protein